MIVGRRPWEDWSRGCGVGSQLGRAPENSQKGEAEEAKVAAPALSNVRGRPPWRGVARSLPFPRFPVGLRRQRHGGVQLHSVVALRRKEGTVPALQKPSRRHPNPGLPLVHAKVCRPKGNPEELISRYPQKLLLPDRQIPGLERQREHRRIQPLSQLVQNGALRPRPVAHKQGTALRCKRGLQADLLGHKHRRSRIIDGTDFDLSQRALAYACG